MTENTTAQRVALARTTAIAALTEYRDAVAAAGAQDASPLSYAPSTALRDNHRYDLANVNTALPFRDDDTIESAAAAELPPLETLLLSLSPRWEDRIRAAVLRLEQHQSLALPDGFPCIYEPADSPRNEGVLRPRPHAWVVSPDEGMLHTLLPLYRELWAAYENQWPHSPNRTFEVGRLDGLKPYSVYRPGTTPEQVIGETMITHTDIYRTAPEHLRRMHPLHEQRTGPALRTSN
jgi:hypothetical protein